MAMDIPKEKMKERIINYLEYMDEESLKEISTHLYKMAMRIENRKRKSDD